MGSSFPPDVSQAVMIQLGMRLVEEAAKRAVGMARQTLMSRQKSPLAVHVDEGITYHYVRVVDEDNKPGCFVHLLVVNNALRPLTNCIGRLIRVARKRGDRYVREHPYKFPLEMKWAFESAIHPITLEPGPPGARLLDLCHTIEGMDKFRFAVERDRGVLAKYEREIYKVLVEVGADGMKPVDASAIIVFDGNWDSIRVIPAPLDQPTPHVDMSMVRRVRGAERFDERLASTSNLPILPITYPGSRSGTR